MKTFVGIDLGSTTTKAVLLDEESHVIGRGITNSRSNYETAARVAGQEARVDGRFTLFRRALSDASGLSVKLDDFLGAVYALNLSDQMRGTGINFALAQKDIDRMGISTTPGYRRD